MLAREERERVVALCGRSIDDFSTQWLRLSPAAEAAIRRAKTDAATAVNDLAVAYLENMTADEKQDEQKCFEAFFAELIQWLSVGALLLDSESANGLATR